MSFPYDNKVAWCPICNQGWVEIVKEIDTGIFFCCCNECESEWDDPENIKKETVNWPEKYGKICDTTAEEIEQLGLDKYIIK